MIKINVLDKGYVRAANVFGTDLDVVNAARCSYDKESHTFEARDQKLLNFLLREGHDSPLRHVSMTFEVFAPLMVCRQWYKHAVASTHTEDQNGWNESSRRYITEIEEFYIPEADQWRSKPENSKQGSGSPVDIELGQSLTADLKDYVERGVGLFEEALESGVAPEQARLFLPANGLYVRWRWTVSLAAIVNFLNQRLDSHAQYEIREYAKAVETLTKEAFPGVFAAIENKNA